MVAAESDQSRSPDRRLVSGDAPHHVEHRVAIRPATLVGNPVEECLYALFVRLGFNFRHRVAPPRFTRGFVVQETPPEASNLAHTLIVKQFPWCAKSLVSSPSSYRLDIARGNHAYPPAHRSDIRRRRFFQRADDTHGGRHHRPL